MALRAFSERGCGGAGLRAIASRAGVSPQLITHHFGSKLALWEAVADGIFAQLGEALREHAQPVREESVPEAMRRGLRGFLRFVAEHPEFVRFMVHEGAHPGPRLEWLFERHVRPLFSALRVGIEAAQERGMAPAGDPFHIAYLLLGASLPYAQAAEFELLTGRDVRAPAVSKAYVDLVERVILPGASA